MKDLFTCGPVFKCWAQWWVSVLQKDQIIDSLLWLLLTVIKTQSFKDDAADFGVDWIVGCIQKQKVISTSAELCKHTFVH